MPLMPPTYAMLSPDDDVTLLLMMPLLPTPAYVMPPTATDRCHMIAADIDDAALSEYADIFDAMPLYAMMPPMLPLSC